MESNRKSPFPKGGFRGILALQLQPGLSICNCLSSAIGNFLLLFSCRAVGSRRAGVEARPYAFWGQSCRDGS